MVRSFSLDVTVKVRRLSPSVVSLPPIDSVALVAATLHATTAAKVRDPAPLAHAMPVKSRPFTTTPCCCHVLAVAMTSAGLILNVSLTSFGATPTPRLIRAERVNLRSAFSKSG